MAKKKKETPVAKVITTKAVTKEEPKELFEVKAEYSPGSSGFLWTLHKSNDIVVTGAQPYETKELAVAAAHEFLNSI